MRKILYLLIISTFSSCLNEGELNLDKYETLVLNPEVLLPFVQIDLSDKFYKEIYDDQTVTIKEIDMEVDLFKDYDISKSVIQIDFNFTTINGFPINFNEISINFMDVNGLYLEQIILNNINAGKLKGDGSLDSPWTKEFSSSFDSTKITNVMATRWIKVVISWKGNPKPYAIPNSSFYFKMNSDIMLTTNIESDK